MSLFVNTVEQPSTKFVYHTNDELRILLNNVHAKCPHITSLYTLGRSVSGTKLLAIVFSRNPLVHEPGKPEFKYVANMHGDEVLGRELMLQLCVYLCENYDRSALVRSLVDLTRIHIVPSINPDGFEQAMVTKQGPGRTNANGVDLNRDFPFVFNTT